MIASMGTPRGYSAERCWQTGRTGEQTDRLLLVADHQLLSLTYQVPGMHFVHVFLAKCDIDMFVPGISPLARLLTQQAFPSINSCVPSTL